MLDFKSQPSLISEPLCSYTASCLARKLLYVKSISIFGMTNIY